MGSEARKLSYQHKIRKAPGAVVAVKGRLRATLMISALGVSLAGPKLAMATPWTLASVNPLLAQEGGDDEKEVPPAEVEKYIEVYKAMQKDRGLTVDQAAQKQGMTVAEFRSLEGKIERDDALRERVRKALRPASASSEGDDSDQ
jgi:hypothetical protein